MSIKKNFKKVTKATAKIIDQKSVNFIIMNSIIYFLLFYSQIVKLSLIFIEKL